MNFRLRSAIQLARSANMPKENVERAISKSGRLTKISTMIV
jgi:transcriptional/translational regulatory protein YebC/TACO1